METIESSTEKSKKNSYSSIKRMGLIALALLLIIYYFLAITSMFLK